MCGEMSQGSGDLVDQESGTSGQAAAPGTLYLSGRLTRSYPEWCVVFDRELDVAIYVIVRLIALRASNLPRTRQGACDPHRYSRTQVFDNHFCLARLTANDPVDVGNGHAIFRCQKLSVGIP